MGVEERQMYEKNKKAKNTGVAILIFGFLLCMLGFASGNAVTVISIGRVVLFAILAITYSLLYGKYKHSTKFRDIGAVSLAISYCLIVFYTKSTYMYAYSYLLLIYAMIYMDKKFTSRYIPAIAILNIICMIRFMVAVEGSTDVALIQGVFATFACVQAYNIVSISERHSKETMQAITDNAEKEREVHQKMVDISNNLSDKFEVAKQTFEEMNESMEASDRAVGEISESTKVTAESVEKQTRLTTDIQSNLENANQDTQKMKEAADASAVAVRAGKTAMEQLASQARLTGELNRKSQETTNELSNRIKDVEDITGEILNISSQTNLLALNASIEAARAGEAGRGFAVVADEIRQLSDQTKNSVNKITEIINRLVENSNEASENMTKSIAATEEQNQMVENAIGDINQIDEKNQMLVELIEQISGQVGYILNANTQITDSISNLSAMSEEVAASSENGKAVMDDSMNAVKQLDDLFTEIYQIAQNMARVAE